jgi:glycine dehydrogenase subunit 1
MSLLGPDGLAQVASASIANTRKLVDGLTSIAGVEAAFDAPRFHEAAIRLPRPVGSVLEALAARGIFGGCDLSAAYPELGDALLVCATETKTPEQLARYRDALAEILA